MKFVAVFERDNKLADAIFALFGTDGGYFFTDAAAEKFIGNKVYGFFRDKAAEPNIDFFFLGEKYRKAFAAVKVKNKGIFHNGMTDKRKIVGNVFKARPVVAIRFSETFKTVIHGGFDIFAPKKNRVAETAEPLHGSSDIFFNLFPAFLRVVKNHLKTSVSDAAQGLQSEKICAIL